MQQRGLNDREPEIELEVARRDGRYVGISDELERPIVDPHRGRVLRGACESEALARGALIVTKPAVTRIGDGGVREQQLARRKRARIGLGNARAIAKEGDLDAESVSTGVLNPAGDVPPFAAKRRMRAGVARKLHRDPGDHRRVIIVGERRAREERECAGEKAAPVQAKARWRRTAITSLP